MNVADDIQGSVHVPRCKHSSSMNMCIYVSLVKVLKLKQHEPVTWSINVTYLVILPETMTYIYLHMSTLECVFVYLH